MLLHSTWWIFLSSSISHLEKFKKVRKYSHRLEIYIFCPLDAHIIRGVLTIYSQVRKAVRSTGLSDTYKVMSFFLAGRSPLILPPHVLKTSNWTQESVKIQTKVEKLCLGKMRVTQTSNLKWDMIKETNKLNAGFSSGWSKLLWAWLLGSWAGSPHGASWICHMGG